MRRNNLWFWLSLVGSIGASTVGCGETDSLVGSVRLPTEGKPCSVEGKTAAASDGCNDCKCTSGVWACTNDVCETPPPAECADGDKMAASDGCNTCACNAGKWACTLMDCSSGGAGGASGGGTKACDVGMSKASDDGCNKCFCTDNGEWACTTMDCTPGSPPPVQCKDGETKQLDCNKCSCTPEGQWACTIIPCPMQPPHVCQKPDETWMQDCNTCTCQPDGTSLCTTMACSNPPPPPMCKDGDKMTAPDGCNTCSCAGGSWACTDMACAKCPSYLETDQGNRLDPTLGCLEMDSPVFFGCSQLENPETTVPYNRVIPDLPCVRRLSDNTLFITYSQLSKLDFADCTEEEAKLVSQAQPCKPAR